MGAYFGAFHDCAQILTYSFLVLHQLLFADGSAASDGSLHIYSQNALLLD
jgi:hypothetical protein